MQGDPARVTAHHLSAHNALVALRSCVQTIERIGGTRYRAIETESKSSTSQVVVDRFGNAYDMNSTFEKLLSNR